MAVIITSAIIISFPSDALEQCMKYILEGLSLLFSAVVLARLSFQVAILTGLYYKVWQYVSTHWFVLYSSTLSLTGYEPKDYGTFSTSVLYRRSHMETIRP